MNSTVNPMRNKFLLVDEVFLVNVFSRQIGYSKDPGSIFSANKGFQPLAENTTEILQFDNLISINVALLDSVWR